MPKLKSYEAKHGISKSSARKSNVTPIRQRTDTSVMRGDNWENALTGLNVLDIDKRVSATPKGLLLKEADAEALYSADGIAEKIVDTLPEDMLREGFKFSSAELTPEEIAATNAFINETLNWRTTFQQALSYARLYGGSAILMGIDEGADPKDELDFTKPVKNFTFMTVLSKYELTAVSIQEDPVLKGYGMPLTYKLDPRVKATTGEDRKGAEVHVSRLLIFQGAPLARQEFIKNGYWGDSVLSKIYRPLQNYSTTHDSVASLMQDFSQAVFKIKNLADILSAKDGRALIKERINMVELSRSVINATIIADDEEFERKTTSLAGVQEIIEKFERRLVSTTSYPHTILLGEAPGGGIGNDGKSQHRDYYDYVARKQESELKKPLRTFMHMVLSSREGPTKGKLPLSWDIEFSPLWQESQGDIVSQHKIQAEADKTYIETGVLSAEEVALSRFGGSRYSHDTKLLVERDGTEGATSEGGGNTPPA